MAADDDQPIIVLGASAGGVEALTTVISGLPKDLGAAVFVVLHISPVGLSVLPQILERAGTLPATHAADGESIRSDWVYVAPPDHHLLVRRGHVGVGRGPSEHRARPAIDPLFRSAAAAYGPQVIGVVLSGTLDDGTAGLRAINANGGVTVVQDPDDALFPGMPASAMRFSNPTHVAPIAEIPELLEDLVRRVAGKGADFVPELPVPPAPDDRATLSDLTCPDCRGVLRQQVDGDLLRFRCRIGHAYSPSSLLLAQAEELERALWSAAVALEEQADLLRRLSQRMTDRGHEGTATRYDTQATEADRQARVVREAVLQLGHTRGHHIDVGMPEEQEGA